MLSRNILELGQIFRPGAEELHQQQYLESTECDPWPATVSERSIPKVQTSSVDPDVNPETVSSGRGLD